MKVHLNIKNKNTSHEIKVNLLVVNTFQKYN
jgi:hypothetical protein